MHMLYNSDSFVVVHFEEATAPTVGAEASLTRGGYEIVDKSTRKEIFIEGAVAQSFKLGVQALVDGGGASEEVFDDYIAGFAVLAQQPVTLH